MKIIETLNPQEVFYRNLCEGLSTPHMRIISEAALTADQINALFGTIEKTATDMGKNRTMVGKGVDVAKLPVKAVQAVDATINKVGKWLQDTTPVKAFDTKFEQLKDQIGDKFPELEKNLTAMGTWAKENPGKTAAIVGVLTTIAGIAGGPIGGAVAGQILRGANELIKGEKLSTAIGKGVKTAAYGALAGMAFNYLSDQISDAIKTAGQSDIVKIQGEMSKANVDQAWANVDPEVAQAFNTEDVVWTKPTQFKVIYYDGPGSEGDYNPFAIAQALEKMNKSTTDFMKSHVFEWPEVYMTREQGQIWNSMMDAGDAARGAAQIAEYGKAMDYLQSIVNDTEQQRVFAGVADLMKSNPDSFGDLTKEQLATLANFKGDLADKIEALDNIGSATGAALQAAVQSQVGKEPKITAKQTKADSAEAQELATKIEKAKTQSESLDEAQILRLFTAVSLHESQLEEGPLDTLKAVGKKAAGAVKGAASAVADKASEVGKGLTTKFTVAKLQKAWEKAGSPTEDTEVLKVLMDLGVDKDILDASFKTAKITMPKIPETPVNRNVDRLLKAIGTKPELKKAVISYLQNTLSPEKWQSA